MGKKRIGWYVLLLLVLFGNLLGWGFLEPVYEDTFLGELKYKQERLCETEGQRLIIAGGSAAAFGVDSSLLKETFPSYEPVNMGMYAGLGTGLILDLIEGQIREGDVILLMPEQDEQTLSDYFDPSYFWQAADGAFYLAAEAGRDKLPRILAGYPAFAGEKLLYHLKGEKPSAGGVYVRASFDAYGDLRAVCEQNRMYGGVDETRPIRLDTEMLTQAFCEQVNGFCAAARKKGAKVYYHFCPMNAAAVVKRDDADGYCEVLSDRLDAELIGTPSDSMLEKEWFYDTNFHLNTAGRRVFTRQLILDLKAAFADTSPTRIEIPQMPALWEETSLQGEDTDADCFEYEIREGEACLTGLTQDGREKESLTVPGSYSGCPVRVLPAGLFSENKKLREVILQENIKRIEDGAFMGAERLEWIRLHSRAPEEILVGDALLEGTKARIRVPEGTLTRYRLGYAWSRYASRIFE